MSDTCRYKNDQNEFFVKNRKKRKKQNENARRTNGRLILISCLLGQSEGGERRGHLSQSRWFCICYARSTETTFPTAFLSDFSVSVEEEAFSGELSKGEEGPSGVLPVVKQDWRGQAVGKQRETGRAQSDGSVCWCYARVVSFISWPSHDLTRDSHLAVYLLYQLMPHSSFYLSCALSSMLSWPTATLAQLASRIFTFVFIFRYFFHRFLYS